MKGSEGGTYTGWLRDREGFVGLSGVVGVGERGSPEARDALVVHGLVRVAPGLEREQVLELLGWGSARLDAAVDVLKGLVWGLYI